MTTSSFKVRPLKAAARLAALLAFGQAAQLTLHAGSPTPEPSPLEQVLNLGALVDDKDAAILQYLGFHGRYHGQYYWLDTNEGDNEGWEHRRFRAGVEATLFHDFDFYSSLNLSADEGDFIENIDELNVKWKPAPTFNLTLGKSKPGFTPEYRDSSRFLITMERSQPVNQVIPERLWGAAAGGQVGRLHYDLGVYSGAADVENYALPSESGGLALWAGLAWNITEAGILRAEWLHQDGSAGNNFVKPLDNAFCLSYVDSFLGDRVNFMAEGIYGQGQPGGRGDFWGLVLMPSWYVTDQVQVVTRYTWAEGETDDALNLQAHYEREAENLISPHAGRYQSAYAGVNYLVHGQRLKLMAGVEYVTAERARDQGDFSGWSVITGVRVYFGRGNGPK